MTKARAESTSTSCTGVVYVTGHYKNQCELVNDPYLTPGDRGSFVLDPGQYHFLSRDEILASANAANYNNAGFHNRFLWYAPMTQVVPSADTPWSDCSEVRSVLTFCSSVNTANTNTVGIDLTQDRTLDAIAYGNDWIALGCGNFKVPVAHDTPTPVIRGFKFNDDNRDGVQDNGETGLGGITFTLSRVASLVNQPNASDLATTTSSASGDFSFALDDSEGPGTYEVTEQYNSNWPNTTLLTQRVVVPEGADNGENLPVLTFGDRQEIPPVAVATPQEVDQSMPTGATVTLDGSLSYSPTNDPITYTWTGPFGTATGVQPSVVMPPGTTPVTLTVSDGIDSVSTTTSVTVYPPITALPVS
ncbi:MAG TPA: SdrD B-like domain-containing protein, partial [Acidimicrobiales bacterium]|nr:SdrD B-like domain-containing protein [Acidimicrobiales bacterium]